MGVLGLWQLLAPVGQPVTLESLENKIFAVDISIWLNQAVKGYRDSTGGSVANAHLLSLFSRLCKLLFYRIRPIIVFDGGFPELKKQTIINRQKRRAAVKHNSREIGLKILTNYLASQQLEQPSASSINSRVCFKHKEKPRDEIYKLPPLPPSTHQFLSDSQESNDVFERKFTNFTKQDIKYLNQIDIDSEDFDNLPPDVKQEILSTLKESRRHRTWDQYEELPKESNEFSNYQMQCLLKKRKLQSKLEQAQKDLRKINSSAYISNYTSDHVIGETNKIMSDDSSYYVLLKKITDNKVDSEKTYAGHKSSVSVMADTKTAFIRDIENIDIDEDYHIKEEEDLNKAIMNSLTDSAGKEDSLDLSGEEYVIDDPPLYNSIKFEHTQTEIKAKQSDSAHKNGDISSVLNNQSVDHETCKSSPTLELNRSNKVYIKETTADKSIPDVEIFCEEKMKQDISDELTVSSDDEMIPCDEIDSTNLYDIKEEKLKDQTKSIQNSNVPFEINTVVEENKQENEYLIVSQKSPKRMTESLTENMTLSDLPSTSTAYSNFSSPSTSKNCTSKLNSDSVSVVEDDLVSETTLNADSPAQSKAISDLFKNLDNQEANLELQKELETAASILEAEEAKQDRQARTVQDHMIEECKELLQLFGIPYIVSPLEAEAQCAFYDQVDLTHGTITDDSDVWLFGGKRVYKNFFTQQKFVESYKDKQIFAHFGLSRKKLINFALLTGSDYTEGIEGVGPVTAMEIISEFPGEGIEALKNFKEWWNDVNKHVRTPENKVKAKLKKLVLYNNFPDENVFDAYLSPEVDSSTEKFSWGRPDLDALREYTRERFGWNQSKVDNILLPVLKKLNERNSQTHIDSFFTVTLRKEKNLFPSKRIMSALKKITSPQKLEKDNKDKNNTLKRKARISNIQRKTKVSKAAVVRTVNAAKSQGPNLSESSSDSDC